MSEVHGTKKSKTFSSFLYWYLHYVAVDEIEALCSLSVC